MFWLSQRCRPVIGSVPAYTRTRSDPQAMRLIEPRAARRIGVLPPLTLAGLMT